MSFPWSFVSGHYRARMSLAPPTYVGSFGNQTYQPPPKSSYVDIGTTVRGYSIRAFAGENPIMTDDGGHTHPVNATEDGSLFDIQLDYAEYDKIKMAMDVRLKENEGFSPVGGRDIDTIAHVGQKLTERSRYLELMPAVQQTPLLSGWGFYHVTPVSALEWLLSTSVRQGPFVFRCWPRQGVDGHAPACRFAPGRTKGYFG